SNDGDDDTGRTDGQTLVAEDGQTATALVAEPAFTRTSSGFLGTSDGWTDLKADGQLDALYDRAATGNVVQTGELPRPGRGRARAAVLALGFGAAAADAQTAAAGSLSDGFDAVLAAQAAGWQAYLGTLKPTPASLQRVPRGDALWSASL